MKGAGIIRLYSCFLVALIVNTPNNINFIIKKETSQVPREKISTDQLLYTLR